MLFWMVLCYFSCIHYSLLPCSTLCILSCPVGCYFSSIHSLLVCCSLSCIPCWLDSCTFLRTLFLISVFLSAYFLNNSLYFCTDYCLVRCYLVAYYLASFLSNSLTYFCLVPCYCLLTFCVVSANMYCILLWMVPS